MTHSNGEPTIVTFQRVQTFPGHINRSNEGERYIHPRSMTAWVHPEVGAQLESRLDAPIGSGRAGLVLCAEPNCKYSV